MPRLQDQYNDKIIEQEIYFENEEIEREEEAREEFLALLLWIANAMQSGRSIKYIKGYIKKKNIDKKLRKDLVKFINGQYEIITGKKGFDLSGETLIYDSRLYTFKEAIKNKKLSNQKRLIAFMSGMRNIIKQSVQINAKEQNRLLTELINNTKRKYDNSREEFFRTQASAGRQQAYNELDKKGKVPLALKIIPAIYNATRVVKGWRSVAVLDERTSAICLSLHNMFYSVNDYDSRYDIPDLPPRHPYCRSMIVTVYEFSGEKGVNYKDVEISAEKFLERNPEAAQKILGKKKYELFASGDYKIESFVTKDRRRFLTNAQIRENLGIDE